MRRLIDFWALLSIVVVFGGALLGGVGWFLHQGRKFREQKEKLLTELHDQLEKNPAIERAVTFLKGSDFEKKLEHLLTPEALLITEAEVALKRDLDALFGLLNRIAQAVSITKILTREETEVFSWYFRLLQHHPILSQYFYNSGFLDLWDFAQSWMEKLSGDETEI
ncbi:MAG: hypothetical protein K8R57_01650 [Verrucomicrobia bacterium]|nr:hypothetical protein [Verrucomicrobiota bacterium]